MADNRMTLADYKGDVQKYKPLAIKAKSLDLRHEYSRSARYAQRRVNQIENRALVAR